MTADSSTNSHGRTDRTGYSVWFHTFGCKANQYDTERMRQELESRGALTVGDVTAANTAVVNTCTVTNRADASARHMIRRLRRLNPRLRIVVAGCSSALREEVYRAMPEVSGVVRGQDPVAVATEVGAEAALSWEDEEPIGGTLLRSNTRGTRGWLKIQDGCDRKCSFCATRLARGASRSRAPGEVLAEARLLAQAHAELVLTGIHIGHYGLDLEAGWTLASLCGLLLEGVPGLRFRLGSIEATEIEDELLGLLRHSGGLLAPHLHIPLQSGSNRVLRAMRRWHTREAYRQRVLEIASRLEPLGLGADVIVGFPGETESDHDRTRALILELPYTYLHVFPFSVRDRTHAATLPDHVPAQVAAERSRELRDIGVEKGTRYAAGRRDGLALIAVETDVTGLTGDYLRVRVDDAALEPGTLVPARLAGPAEELRAVAGATGRAALPVLRAAVQSV
jgi:threonylcarbamoyladenosine tRNA methylthiotransferase MtaB